MPALRSDADPGKRAGQVPGPLERCSRVTPTPGWQRYQRRLTVMRCDGQRRGSRWNPRGEGRGWILTQLLAPSGCAAGSGSVRGDRVSATRVCERHGQGRSANRQGSFTAPRKQGEAEPHLTPFPQCSELGLIHKFGRVNLEQAKSITGCLLFLNGPRSIPKTKAIAAMGMLICCVSDASMLGA